ncbi:daunorubicin resistance protein DrrA family ABC transporter ATP-binding protein [Nocardiopsis dassonvillei]|uniref:Daunorubicin resistance ABC transporter ATPase subunit n=1 Tax=Nocardiopsis dassonvillei (strain ATCC 23218 / DSM 43111 / CIP 107115 / JCM 7437 / KCTC 9190 / NBRC 14626 / NCTC 10488 / NRRL B-5397 / IMRU 509) TaxID=446468 RepID=D7AZ81_NOCDD|nr:daunorubicin resistance protein DrrA family ABC transporter ATP-binding protein [Nocardiopsis dassonvillei]ADH70061.1 daunorubicin resistance ABC transporter ATPase subunit [Nocardiopsis dassonvillei subsp. dassonvillei DSM 43111]NKY78435.1 daunorubicin resistance protein DrrA family ABC transporter ATP-binding protein [Nocardiopsis dassonvillei]VEI90576.1 Daunorubicin/doxorubicin resistance ATP-binding protein DrrA [Nocardiopsis dassonvillei]
MNTTGGAITARGLGKRYGRSWALRGFDLDVPAGSVCGLLGPNGAGKTTAVRVLATLLRADEGTARVAGYDVASQGDAVRRSIGLVGQNAAVDEVLSGRQNLEMFGRLYHLGARRAAARADELLERFRLADTGRKPVSAYSGGMRRRLDLAASMILSPPVLFLDEPTVGLDPRGRNEVWNAVRALVAGDTTVLLTTQYLEEADQLADRISVVDSGRVVAEGTPEELKSRLGGDRLDVVLHEAAALDRAAALIGRVTGERPEVEADARRIGVGVRNRVAALTEVVRALEEEEIEVEDVALRRPTLDEVFLHLTGGHEDRGDRGDRDGHGDRRGREGVGEAGEAGNGDDGGGGRDVSDGGDRDAGGGDGHDVRGERGDRGDRGDHGERGEHEDSDDRVGESR